MCHAGITIERARYAVSEAEGSVEVCAVQNGQLPAIQGNVIAVLSTVALSGPQAATGMCTVCLLVECMYMYNVHHFPFALHGLLFHYTLLHVK